MSSTQSWLRRAIGPATAASQAINVGRGQRRGKPDLGAVAVGGDVDAGASRDVARHSRGHEARRLDLVEIEAKRTVYCSGGRTVHRHRPPATRPSASNAVSHGHHVG